MNAVGYEDIPVTSFAPGESRVSADLDPFAPFTANDQ